MTGTGGGNPGRRPVVRWAWRLFRREWRQQLLVLSLMTVAVAAAVAGSTTVLKLAEASDGSFGDAGAIAQVDGRDPAAARAAMAEAEERFGGVEVIAHSSVQVPGSTEPLDVRDQDPAGPLGAPMLSLLDGRYPTEASHVALTHDVAELLSADVGDQVELGGVEREVVGLVENPSSLSEDFALVAPGTAASSPDSFTLLIDDVDEPGSEVGPSERSAVDATQPPLGVMSRGDSEKAAVTAGVLIVTTLAMALVGLIAAAGFVVVTQRRQRQLGLLSAMGATARHLRLVMLADGAIVGVIAGVLGTGLGLLVWLAAAPAVETAADHRVDRLDAPWGVILAILLLGVAMATAAAWWPARTTARMPVMTALSGRPSRPLPVHRSLTLAVVLLAVGIGCIAASHPTEDDVPPVLLLVLGVAAVVLGTVFIAPAAVRALAAPARLLPFAPRLALRDLARFQGRAAAALAAITLGLGISVSVIAIAAANQYRSDEGNLSNRQLLVLSGDERTALDVQQTEAERSRLDEQAAAVAAAVGGETTTFTLDVALNPDGAQEGGRPEPVTVATQTDAHSFSFEGIAYVASPALLEHYDIDPATVADDTELLTARGTDVVLLDISSRPDPADTSGEPDVVQHVDLSPYSDGPSSLITEAGMQQHGWVATRSGWLIESSDPLTSEQVAAARAAAADVGLAIEARSGQDALAQLRTGATAAGTLLAVGIVAMAVGLLRTESARDLRTLTATGASARTRRSITATTAAALAALGVVLGVGGAYAALVAGYADSLDHLVPLPITHLAALAVGVPLAAATAGWLLAGREPRTFARQALD